MSRKVTRQCFFGCDPRTKLFSFPKDESTRKAWSAFISYDRSPSTLCICARHFTADCFENKMQYDAGFSSQLLLKPGSVPTVKDFHGDPEPSAASIAIRTSNSTSQQPPADCSYQTFPLQRVSIATQTVSNTVSLGTQFSFRTTAVSVGTQLSYRTRTEHVRSKGTQARTPCVSIRTQTKAKYTGFPPSSKPVKASGAIPRARPVKRARLDLQGDEEMKVEQSSPTIKQEDDSTDRPVDSLTVPSEMSRMDSTSPHNEAKYIVFESCLRELFQTCPLCKRDCDVQQQKRGTYVAFRQKCPNCLYVRQWQSQPVRGSTPVGNLQMSAGVYLTGASFIQLEKICKAINLQMIKFNTFQKHARMFLEPAIVHKWHKDQETVLHDLKQKGKAALCGDMRTASPGHSAKYGSYTLMSLDSNKIVDIQLVQRNKVTASVHMEKEGLRRGLEYLQSKLLDVDYIMTARRTQVQELLREKNITQYFDARHLEKGLFRKLAHLAKNKECKIVSKWLPSIKNQVYVTAASSKTGPEKVAQWKSIVNHVQDVHVHEDPLYPKCAHEDKVSRDPNKWLQPGSTALYKVEKLMMNKRVLHDVEKLSHHYQAASLEDFQRAVLHFAPQDVDFPFIGVLCRLYLAALHFNENAQHEQTSAEENLNNNVTKSKEKKGMSKPVKKKPTFTYVRDLMTSVFEKVFEDPSSYVEELKQISIPV